MPLMLQPAPTEVCKGERDLGFRVSALGFKGIDWRPLQGQARGKPVAIGPRRLRGQEERQRDRRAERQRGKLS